jgi:hypothetical protein
VFVAELYLNVDFCSVLEDGENIEDARFSAENIFYEGRVFLDFHGFDGFLSRTAEDGVEEAE